MKRALQILLIAAAFWFLSILVMVLGGCAARHTPAPDTPSAPAKSWRDVPQVSTRRGGIAHICPYSPTLAYTARHVVLDPIQGGPWLIPLNWGQGPAGGTLFPLYLDARRDLAVGCTDEPFGQWFERASVAPLPGAKVRVPSYKWLSKGAPREDTELVVAEVVAGVIRFESSASAGSSGSCVLDENNRVVAVTSGGVGGLTTFGISVWGEWGEIPPQWRDAEKYGWVNAARAAKEGCAAEHLK